MKLDPDIVTISPPLVSPLFGLTPVTIGKTALSIKIGRVCSGWAIRTFDNHIERADTAGRSCSRYGSAIINSK